MLDLYATSSAPLHAAAASTVSPLLENIQDKMQEQLSQSGMASHSAREIAKTGTGLLAAALGAATGAPAAAAFNTEFNNRQLHQSEKDRIKKLAKGDHKREAELAEAACALVRCSAEFPEGSPLHQFFKEVESRGNSADRAADRELLRAQMSDPAPYQTVVPKPMFTYDTGDRLADNAKKVNNTYQITTRLGGVFQAAGSAVGVAGGTAMAATAAATCFQTGGLSCLAVPAGVYLASSSADNVRAGIDTATSGKPQNTLGALFISDVTGVSPQAAELIYAGTSVVAAAGGSAILRTAGKLTTAEQIGLLRDAVKGKGNFNLGQGTMSEADALSRAWVGPNYRVASDGKTLVSVDGLRIYRPPSPKNSPYATTGIQANFERLEVVKGRPTVISNGHLDITP